MRVEDFNTILLQPNHYPQDKMLSLSLVRQYKNLQIIQKKQQQKNNLKQNLNKYYLKVLGNSRTQ